jgi:DME family drug/metabolite transporter
MKAYGLSPLMVTGAAFTSPVVVLLPAAVVHGVVLQADAYTGSVLLLVVLVSTVLPFWLFYSGMQSMRAGTASLLVTLEPVAAVVLAYLILGEALGAIQILGGVVIVSAVTLLALQGARHARPPA